MIDRVTVIVVESDDPTWHLPPTRVRVFEDGRECYSGPTWQTFLAADRLFGYTDAKIVRVIQGVR